MAEGGWLPTYIFMCMVSMADKSGHLRHDPRTLYRRIGLNVDDRVSFNEFMDAIEYLEDADKFSNLPAEQGKRIVPAKFTDEMDGNRGWLIVNYVHYRDKGGSIEQRRAQDAARKRKQRSPENNNLEDKPSESHVTVPASHGESAHTDTDTDTVTDTDTKEEYPAKLCVDAWLKYLDHRKDIRKPKLTDKGMAAAIKCWCQYSHEAQIAAVEDSITQGYTGCWPENHESKLPSSKPTYAQILAADMDEKGML